MAVKNEDLMNLLLTYSASHRARLLHQPEPTLRIALWVQDIFPNLRKALTDPDNMLSNETLATAIMLASLEIIAPNTFGQVAVTWQDHLVIARQIIAARGGSHSMKDPVSSFLLRWFLYLDVLGSLSGANISDSTDIPASIDEDEVVEEDNQVDCLLGFSPRCVMILAKIADLARICDRERIGSDYNIRPGWQPTRDMIVRGERLKCQLEDARADFQPCSHTHPGSEADAEWDNLEMAAVNEAFHCAGLVHIHRRILGKPITHPDVQAAVSDIIGLMYKIRKGSPAQGCLLFPIFTAGCDAQDQKQRLYILDRVKDMEQLGMAQVGICFSGLQHYTDYG
jgi:hypothetical protein